MEKRGKKIEVETPVKKALPNPGKRWKRLDPRPGTIVRTPCILGKYRRESQQESFSYYECERQKTNDLLHILMTKKQKVHSFYAGTFGN